MIIESQAADGLLKLLETRRSAGVSLIGEPGPGEGQLHRLLTIAARAPDHGGLEPWRFIIIEGEARAQAGQRLAECYEIENAAMEPGKLQKFAAIMGRLFTGAPVTAIVVSRPDFAAKIPVFEQELSAGAVCMNLLMAAHAMGFAANWVTGFAAASLSARMALGVAEGERIAGVIFIGTMKDAGAELTDRKRPDIEAITTRWAAKSA